VPATKIRHSAEEGDAVGAAAVAAEALQKEMDDFGGDAVLEAFGLFMRAGPREAEDLGEEFFGEAMAEDEMLRGSLPFGGELDAAIAAHMKITGMGHALERGGDGGRGDAEVFGEARANGYLLLLDNFPGGFEVVFLRNAGFFAAQGASR